MKVNSFLLSIGITLFAFLCGCGNVIDADKQIAVIPVPSKTTPQNGVFKLTSKTAVVTTYQDDELAYALAAWKDIAGKMFATEPVVKSEGAASHAIVVKKDAAMEPEAYSLSVKKTGIVITGGSSQGVFYAFQTLRQMIPVEAFADSCVDIRNVFQRNKKNCVSAVQIPCVEIEDKPFFGYRGMMFDVCRHFFTVEDIKEAIDILALHKMNTFHWHLTEDQGWRIEIKKYPKLTEIGSVRKETVIGHNSGKFDGKPYGGFFTQEQVKEVVQYAKERFITVIPEIEIPGHSVAALAAYPELGCTGKGYEVLTQWGVDSRVLCPGKESTFTFIEDVLTEVMALFPSEYIHIGGDECPTSEWEKCPYCRKRMRQEGLKTPRQLQNYVTARVEKFLNAHGRKLIGWDEILEGEGLSQTATVMSWRGSKGGIEAAKRGNHVIMSPNTHCYLDYYQSKDKEKEPDAIGGFLPVEKVYALDPYDKLNNDEKQYILGVQGNLWTEYIDNYEKAQYMILPRLSAIAEVGWSYENKDYDNFIQRLQHLAKIFDANGYNYAKHVINK